ncbi:helix-turn-helix transcriptional regulator [Tenacibaculum sp. M341]|uniref:helix-turn-helix transcriptional regulator n=1 Tax=Tenacibaculum sp. M341 TaxID=2530339 RepID=UPI001049EA4B|nr:WYL domain-containing protein [Tenacibaculum sp. M341]TCI85310.1 WYL domain-containing protein [Tenacibaculum sp. M341]
MTNSKHAHLRYNILDYCFRKKAFTFNQLLTYVNEKIAQHYPEENISERTLRDDLKLFRDSKKGFGAPLPSKARILQYENLNFSIASKPLLAYEQYLIDASVQLLERFENHPKYDRLAEALFKFQDNETLANNTDISKVVFFDHNEEYKGIHHLKPLYHAIHNKNVLKITYKGFKDSTPNSYKFHPYYLKQYDNRWFSFGQNPNFDNITNLTLDRIINIEISDKQYAETRIDFKEYFEGIIGVTFDENQNPIEIIISIEKSLWTYIKTKPLHGSQKVKQEHQDHIDISLQLIPNYELESMLLQYGERLTVLEPETLRKSLKERTKMMMANYNSVDTMH